MTMDESIIYYASAGAVRGIADGTVLAWFRELRGMSPTTLRILLPALYEEFGRVTTGEVSSCAPGTLGG